MVRQELLEGMSEKLHKYFYVAHHIKCESTASDLVQETFFRVIRTAGSLEKPLIYFVKTARAVLMDHYRREFRREEAFDRIAEQFQEGGENKQPEINEVVDRVRDALMRIKPARVNALRSLIIDGESSREIGKKLGRGQRAILRTAEKGKADLRRLIGNDLL